MNNTDSYIKSEEKEVVNFENDLSRVIPIKEDNDSTGMKTEATQKWVDENEREYDFDYKLSVSVYDVAEYILRQIGPMTTMKLQKLVYYSQAWSLVWDEQPLFKEDIEAWANGPVVRKLFYYHKGHFQITNVTLGNPELLTEQQKKTIDTVLDFYGSKKAQWLIDLAHMENPWKDTRKGLSSLERGSSIIPLDTIADYYSSL